MISLTNFWFSFMCILSGSFLIAAGRNKSTLVIATSLVLAIVTTYYTVQLSYDMVTLATVLHPDVEKCNGKEYPSSCNKIHTAWIYLAFLAATAITAFIALMMSLVFTIKAIGCCAEVSVYIQHGDVSMIQA